MAPHVDGHMIGGFFYMLWGLTAWVIPSMWSLIRERGPQIFKTKKNGKRTQSIVESEVDAKLNEHLEHYTWLPQPCCSPRFPFEPIIKIIIPTIGIIIEIFLVVKTPPHGKAHVALLEHPFHIWNDDGTIDNHGIKKPYHATVYGGFLMAGVIDIIAMVIYLPKQTSPIFVCIAFVSESILFFFHLRGQQVIEGHIHSVLTTIVLGCIIFSAARVFYPSKFVINLALGCTIIALGLWFFQTGYIRNYNHQYYLIKNLNDTSNMSLESNEMVHMFQWYITACFAWTVIGVAASMVILWMLLLCINKGLHHCRRIQLGGRYKSMKDGDFAPMQSQFRGCGKMVHTNCRAEEKENLIVPFDESNAEPDHEMFQLKTLAT